MAPCRLEKESYKQTSAYDTVQNFRLANNTLE